MNAIVLYTRESDKEVAFEYNFFDNQFAPGNLVVRKVLMSMLNSVRQRLTHLEVEYNDSMLADKLGAKRAGELLRFLGATRENRRDNRSGEIVVSRTFRAELTSERFEYFYNLLDVSELSHYRLLEGERDRIVFYFTQYLLLRCPSEESALFLKQLDDMQVPYKLVSIQ
ncbi:hypothetical protein [Brevibacillus sp. H7]|uniref:hypothetical protein n=1 Tax=Brevibacillus sp. H7 TaxID=3349138 RepID=UPI0037FF64A1